MLMGIDESLSAIELRLDSISWEVDSLAGLRRRDWDCSRIWIRFLTVRTKEER